MRKDKHLSTSLLFILLLIVGILVRYYHFSSRITFGPEQAISLITSANYLEEKFSLLGQEYLLRTTSSGHRLFAGPIFNYSLVPLLLIFNYDPLLITLYFAFLNLITGVVLYWVCTKHFGVRTAQIAMLLFLFNGTMIYHSMFIWILNYLPLLFVVTLHLLAKYRVRRKKRFIFTLGILSGLGIGMEYFYVFTTILLLGIVIYKSKIKVIGILMFVVGILLANTPTLLFEVRHGFYNLKSLYWYLLTLIGGGSEANISYYHFLHFYPLLFIMAAIIIQKFSYGKNLIIWFILLIYIVVNLYSDRVNFIRPTGMPDGLNYPDLIGAAEIIAADKPDSFNLVTLYDFDTRGHVLRYPVEFVFGYKPMGVVQYKETGVIYALSDVGYNYNQPKVWELEVFGPYRYRQIGALGKNFGVYKLYR